MELVYVICFTSFLLGAASYIIARFWIVPIWKYHGLRIRITDTLVSLTPPTSPNELSDDPSHTSSGDTAKPQPSEIPLTDKALKIRVRKYAVALSDHYTLELPQWYRLVLFQREEKCEEAAREMMKLANISNPVQMDEKIRAIRELLRLK